MFLFCSVSAPSSSSDKSSVINLLSAAQQRYRVNSLLMNMMDTKQRPRSATWMLILLISDRPVNTWMFQQWLHQFLQTLMWHIPHFVIFHKCNRKLETCRTNAGVSLSIFNKVLKTKLFPNMVFLHTSNSYTCNLESPSSLNMQKVPGSDSALSTVLFLTNVNAIKQCYAY